MKKYILLVVTVLLTGVFLLSGCGKTNNALKENPTLLAPIVNNGGMSVQKGDYLYFINGYTASSELKAGDNDWGDTKYGAIYRTKLASNKISYDEDGFLTNVDLVIPKLVGYENGSFYVYGNYIYYSTPNNSKDNRGNSLINLTDFFRADINGTNNTLLYTSTSDGISANDWSVYVIGNNHYLVVKDGAQLVSVKSNDKVAKPVVMAKDVTSASFLNYDTFYNNERMAIETYNNYIYYTRSVRESDNIPSSISGNYLARVKVGTNSENIIFTANTDTYTMVEIKNNSIYYNVSNSTSLIANLLFRSHINELNKREQLTFMSYDKTFILNSETEHVGNYVLGLHSNVLYLLNGAVAPKEIMSDVTSVLKVYGDQAIVLDSDTSSLKRINNVKDNNISVTSFGLDEKTIKTDSVNYIDYDGRTIYFFANYKSENDTENLYLNRIDTNTNSPITEFVGSFSEDHLPVKPDNEDLPEDEWVKWIR